MLSGTHRRLSSLCLALAVTALVLSGARRAWTQEPAAAATEEEKLSTPELQADFEKARALFSEGEYKEAEREFRKQRTSTRSKEDREILDRWITGCAGVATLEKLKQLEKSRGKVFAYQQAQALYVKYKDSAAVDAYVQYIKELEDQLYVSIEDFNVQSAAYSKKYGKVFIDNRAASLDGSLFLRWTSTADRKAAALKVSGPSIPPDWSQFSAVEFWVNVRMAPRGPEAVIRTASGAGKAAGVPDGYFYPLKELGNTRGKWARIRIPITEFKPQGDPVLSKVTAFQIQIPAGAQFDIWIDKISLVRKESTPAGG